MNEKQKRLLFLCAHRSVRELMAALVFVQPGHYFGCPLVDHLAQKIS
jgi:hypothetical protein